MLTFDRVSFRYGRRGAPVLSGFSWNVPDGRTVVLGPNGAGKTTLLAIGADALVPQEGRVVLNGDDQRRGERRRRVGWMPQQINAVPGLTCREQVAYAGWLKGLSQREAWHRSARALNDVGLADLADRSASKVSGGQLRRVGLAQVLVADAAVLLLDEPTAGLDPGQRSRFREIVGELSGIAVVISTHQVDDLSELFETVVVLHEGIVRFEGPVPAFLALSPVDGPRRAEAAYGGLVGGEH